MPPLIQKWNILKDEDKDLFPLLEVSILVFVTVLNLIWKKLTCKKLIKKIGIADI